MFGATVQAIFKSENKYDIPLFYHIVFRYRYVVAVLIFFLLVVNKIHFSSIAEFDRHIQPGYGSEFSDPIFGESRPIRSDEWLVSTPSRLSAQYPPTPYGKFNYIMRGTQTENMALQMQISYATLSNPLNFGYLLGPDYGTSMVWCGMLIITFMVSLEIMYIVSKKSHLLAITGACLITFSPFFQWWSYTVWIPGGLGAIVCFYYFIQADSKVKKTLFAFGTGVFFSFFVVSLYPPWQVPSGYLFLGFAIWIIYENRTRMKQFKRSDWCIAGLALIFIASILFTHFWLANDYMKAIMNTVYPGSRISIGGEASTIHVFDKLMNGGIYAFLSLSQPIITPNVSEFGGFLALFPIPMIFSIFIMLQKKKYDLLSIMLIVFSLIFGTYILIGWPEWLAKATLMSTSLSFRALDIVLFAQVFLLIGSLSRFKDTFQNKSTLDNGIVSWPSLLGAILVGIFLTLQAIYFSRIDFAEPINPMYFILVCAGLTLVTYYIFAQRFHQRVFKIACIYLICFSLFSGMGVNPIMRSLDAIYSKPVASKIIELAKNTDEKWIGLDDGIHGSRISQQFLIACGASTINSVNLYPNMELWQKLDPAGIYDEVYNRFAHIIVTLTNEPTSFDLIFPDAFALRLSYNDLATANVKFIYSSHAIENQENVQFELLYNESNSRIYQVYY